MPKRPSAQLALFGRQKKEKPLENRVQGWIRNYLRARNVYHQRINSGQIRTREGHVVKLADKGTPDLYALYRGVSVWIECKREGETAEDHQTREHGWIRKAGGVVVVAYKVEDVRDALMEIDALLDSFSRLHNIAGIKLDLLTLIRAMMPHKDGSPTAA